MGKKQDVIYLWHVYSTHQPNEYDFIEAPSESAAHDSYSMRFGDAPALTVEPLTIEIIRRRMTEAAKREWDAGNANGLASVREMRIAQDAADAPRRQTAFASYEECRTEAQRQANATGRPIGVELFVTKGYGPGEWVWRFLPEPSRRFGCDARCEVVLPENRPDLAEAEAGGT